MKELIENVFNNTKEAYKESIILDNEKIQDLLFLVLDDIRRLENILDTSHSIKQMETSRKTTYTEDQVRKITKIQLCLAKNELSTQAAEDKILKVSPTFPVQHLNSYNKRMQKYLEGTGEYGFAFPSNWAKALLEETNNNPLVIKAFKEQQSLYLNKDGRINKKLDDLLNSL